MVTRGVGERRRPDVRRAHRRDCRPRRGRWAAHTQPEALRGGEFLDRRAL